MSPLCRRKQTLRSRKPTLRQHKLTLFSLDFDRLLTTTSNFEKIMADNPALYVSMRNQFIPAMKKLIAELNDLLATPEALEVAAAEQRAWILSKLSAENAAIYESLPEGVAKQLTMERDPHGNVQVSLIETEKLLSEMVATKLAAWKEEGKFVGKFAAQHHFFGYEGRC